MPRTVIKVMLLIALVHVLVTAGSPHVAHHLLKMKVKEVAKKSSTNSEQFIAGEILEYATDKRLPIGSRNVTVWRKRGQLHVWIDYDRDVVFPFHEYAVELELGYPEGTVPPGWNSRHR